MKTLVIGASLKPERYSNQAIKLLRKYNHQVIAIGSKAGKILDVEIQNETPLISDIHTVTLYLNPVLQKQYYNYILNLKPRRIIFNPGTENDELIELAQDIHIECIENCTLVMLHNGMF